MYYLGLALYAEGPRDYHFLCPLLMRLCETVCMDARGAVDIGEVSELDHSTDVADRPRCERIAQAATEHHPAWQVLFVHADADGDLEAARSERVKPGLDRVRDAGLARAEGVAVVPVRETEAWALCDGNAIRSVFGTSLSDTQLELPQGRSVEQLTDPKAKLDAVHAIVFGARNKNRIPTGRLLGPLGEQISIDRLRQLPSFQLVEHDLREALRSLQLLE